MYWEHLREEEFYGIIEESRGVCVITCGAIEMHGQHLPVGTDNMVARYVLGKAAAIEPVCIFPEFSFGDVHGLTTKKGSVILSVELMQMMLTELCSEIARNGFKKILLLNNHGGNHALLNNFVRSTMHAKKDYVVLTAQIHAMLPKDILEQIELKGIDFFPELMNEDIEVLREFVASKKYGGHACFGETAAMLSGYPELVRMDKIHDTNGIGTGKSQDLADAGLTGSQRFWGIEFPDSYQGHAPDGCNKRIGDVSMRCRIDKLVETLHVLKYDDKILRWNEEWNAAW